MYRDYESAGCLPNAAHGLADASRLGVVSLFFDVERGGYGIDKHQAKANVEFDLEVLGNRLQLINEDLQPFWRIKIRDLLYPRNRQVLIDPELMHCRIDARA